MNKLNKETGTYIMTDYLFVPNGGAVFSPTRLYRYVLWRIWNSDKPLLMVIGLNPSTANEDTDDPTIKTVCAVANHNGYGGVHMTNLFSFISTDPKALQFADDWDINLKYINESAIMCRDVCYAWGNFQVHGRDKIVMGLFPFPKCFGKNSNGSPRHPMYMKHDTILQPFVRV